MPGFDGTGPWGEGPMTGRALGICAGGPYPAAFGPGPGFGRGRGLGRGRGRGWGRGPGWGRGFGFRGGFGPWGYGPAPYYGGAPYGYGVSRSEEKAMLEQELGFIKERMEEINQRITELESESQE
ncbi:MAG: DUF5320 domain-containing protein [bacterium]